MMIPNFSRIGCLIWCISTVVIHAFNLKERLEPEGPLGFRLDYNLAVSWPTPINAKGQQIARSFLWSTHLKFMQPVSKISDGQLWQMAHDAFDEMDADAARYDVKNKPGAVSVLAFGNEVIITSSMKSKTRFAYNYPPSTVKDTLQLCQDTWQASGGAAGKTHKNSGNCGEVMVAQLYYTIHDAPLADQKARIGAVLVNDQGQRENTPPCGTNQNNVWGCNLFVSREVLTVMDKTTAKESYNLATLAGGLDTVGQIQICGSPTTK